MGLMKEYGTGAEIDVRVPSRTLTDREVEELNIRLNKNTGSFDFDILANNFEVDDLLDWGFEPFELSISIPEPTEQEEPLLGSEHLVEIYCTSAFLNEANGQLDSWSQREDVTVNIS